MCAGARLSFNPPPPPPTPTKSSLALCARACSQSVSPSYQATSSACSSCSRLLPPPLALVWRHVSSPKRVLIARSPKHASSPRRHIQPHHHLLCPSPARRLRCHRQVCGGSSGSCRVARGSSSRCRLPGALSGHAVLHVVNLRSDTRITRAAAMQPHAAGPDVPSILSRRFPLDVAVGTRGQGFRVNERHVTTS